MLGPPLLLDWMGVITVGVWQQGVAVGYGGCFLRGVSVMGVSVSGTFSEGGGGANMMGDGGRSISTSQD